MNKKILNIISVITFFSSSFAMAFSINLNDLGKIVDAGSSVLESFEDLTPEQEHYLGRAVAARILNQHELVDNPALQNYLNQLVTYLSWHSDRPETFGGYHAAIFISPIPSAYSTPDGLILMSDTLLNSLNNEDELAAILAHEIAHVSLQHGMASIQKSSLAKAGGIIGKEALSQAAGGHARQVEMLSASFGSSVEDVVKKITTAGYSRSQEIDADKIALEILYKAGYAPPALHQLLTDQNQKDHSDALNAFTATHPSNSDRLAEINRQIKNKKLHSEIAAQRTERFNAFVK